MNTRWRSVVSCAYCHLKTVCFESRILKDSNLEVYWNICGDVGYVSTSWCYLELSKLGINTIATWTKLAEVSGVSVKMFLGVCLLPSSWGETMRRYEKHSETTTRSYVQHILTLWSQKSGWQRVLAIFSIAWDATLIFQRNVVGWWGPVRADLPTPFPCRWHLSTWKTEEPHGQSNLCHYEHFLKIQTLLVGWNLYRPYSLFRKPWQYDLDNLRARLLFPRSLTEWRRQV